MTCAIKTDYRKRRCYPSSLSPRIRKKRSPTPIYIVIRIIKAHVRVGFQRKRIFYAAYLIAKCSCVSGVVFRGGGGEDYPMFRLSSGLVGDARALPIPTPQS